MGVSEIRVCPPNGNMMIRLHFSLSIVPYWSHPINKNSIRMLPDPPDPGFFPVVRPAPVRILALSHKGVVRLLELAFPHAIDKLQPDEGHRDGQKPVVVDDVPLEVRPGLLDRWWGFRYDSPP